MTRQEVQELLMMISSAFPNFKPENKTQIIDTWLLMLEEYNQFDVFLALKSYIHSNNSGFAPSISQLIAEMDKPKELATLDDSKAWAMVRAAISRSTYNSVKEFEKLPPTVQQAVGSAEILRYWAMDEGFDEGVAMSHFLKNYRTITKRKTDFDKLPVEMKSRVGQFIEQCAQTKDGALLIGVATGPKDVELVENDKPLGEYVNRVSQLFE